MYTILYFTILSCAPCRRPAVRPARRAGLAVQSLGAKDCTPEINTSGIVVDVQSMDFQRHFPTEFHLSVAFSSSPPSM